METGIKLAHSDPIYRDFTYLNFNSIDSAYKKANNNHSESETLEAEAFDKLCEPISDLERERYSKLIVQSKYTAEYYLWVCIGLKDLWFQDAGFFPEMLRVAVSSLDQLPVEDRIRYMGYHDGFYFEFFKRPIVEELMGEIDGDWHNRKIRFGPPQIDNHKMEIWDSRSIANS